MKSSVIVLDMDNTILRSHIDFILMQQLVGLQLVELGKAPAGWQDLTTAQIVEAAKKRNLTAEEEADVWYTVAQVERLGMADAIAEYGVLEALQKLKLRYLLIVVTNNAKIAAETALKRTGLFDIFDRVIAREDMPKLKPEPDGLVKLKKEYPEVPAKNWLFIGDSWVDGMAAQKAGMQFALYEGHRQEDWSDKQIDLVFKFANWRDIENRLAEMGF